MFCVVRSKLLTSYYIVDNKAWVATGNCLTLYSFVLCCVGIALYCLLCIELRYFAWFALHCLVLHCLLCAASRDIARCVRCCARYVLGMGTAGVIMHAVSRIKQYSCSFHQNLMSTVRHCGYCQARTVGTGRHCLPSTVRHCGSRARRCNGNCWQRLLGVVCYRSSIQKSMYPRW